MRFVMYAVLFAGISLFCTAVCVGQNTSKADFQTWTDFTLKLHLSNKSRLGGDAGTRGLVSSKDWNLIYIRPTYHYYFNQTVHTSTGMAFFYTANKVLGNVSEFRLFQEVDLLWPNLTVVTFNNRLRFEERFFFYENQTQMNDWYARGRYELHIESQDFSLFQFLHNIYLLAALEYFLPFNNSAAEVFINRNRLVLGFGHRISNKFRYELQYINQKSREFKDDGLKTTENILRLRLYYEKRRKDNDS